MEFEIRSPCNHTELELIFDFLGNCFTRNTREYFVKRTLNDPNFDLWQLQTLWVKGKPISNVKIYDKSIWLNGKKVKVAGIGSVATEFSHRGCGLALILMRKAIQVLQSRRYKVAMLFTRIPNFYEKLNFFVTPRVTCNFARTPLEIPEDHKIRSFHSPTDFPAVMQIHRIFSSSLIGCVVRDAREWHAQRKYFNESEALFLVLEDKGEIKGYIRGNFENETGAPIVKLVEYGSKDLTLSLLPLFVNLIFSSFKIQKVFITLSKRDSKALIQECRHVSVSTDNLMMLNIIDKRGFSMSDVDKELVCFWEADGF